MATLNVNEFRDKVHNMLNNLPYDVLKVNHGLALSVIPMVTNRIISKGIDGQGNSFGKYSVNPLPTFYFTNKSTGSGAEEKLKSTIRRKRKEATKTGEKFKGISYTEFRNINNLPTEHVTMSFTGETLKDIGVTDEVVDGNLVLIGMGAKNTASKARYNAKGERIGEDTSEKILDYLGDRYGEEILSVSIDEENLLAEAFGNELERLIDNYLA